MDTLAKQFKGKGQVPNTLQQVQFEMLPVGDEPNNVQPEKTPGFRQVQMKRGQHARSQKALQPLQSKPED
jgi:hypothetical protein